MATYFKILPRVFLEGLKERLVAIAGFAFFGKILIANCKNNTMETSVSDSGFDT
jgi:hypothetical protein